jgi:hypothetical protein
LAGDQSDINMNIDISPTARKALFWILDIFDSHDITYQITGGLAAKIYGSPRILNDIDIEVSSEHINLLESLVKKQIVFGPQKYQDDFFDLVLMTLSYLGQKIDISFSEGAKVFDQKSSSWIADEPSFHNSERVDFFGKEILVIAPLDFVEYKSRHMLQKYQIDIDSCLNYLNKN